VTLLLVTWFRHLDFFLFLHLVFRLVHFLAFFADVFLLKTVVAQSLRFGLVTLHWWFSRMSSPPGDLVDSALS